MFWDHNAIKVKINTKGYGVSFWGDANVLEQETADGYTHYTVLNATELYIFKEKG